VAALLSEVYTYSLGTGGTEELALCNNEKFKIGGRFVKVCIDKSLGPRTFVCKVCQFRIGVSSVFCSALDLGFSGLKQFKSEARNAWECAIL